MLYRIGDCIFDTDERCLIRDGETVKLRPRLFQALLIFVENKGRLLSKREISDKIDPGIHTHEDAFSRTISDLRKALGEEPGENKYIKTHHRIGYRFVAKVEELQRDTPEVEQSPRGALNDSDAAYNDRPFLRWLLKNVDQFPAPTLSSRGKLERDVIIGNSVIVNTAPSEKGYTDIRLKEVEVSVSEFDDLMALFRLDWEKELSKNKDFDGTKATPMSVTVPVTDSSPLYINFGKIPYYILRSFHMMVEKHPTIQELLVKQAFEWSGRRTIPASLCIDGVVIMASEPNEEEQSTDRYLLLAHRVFREDGDRPNCWSASFEEQFAPINSYYRQRMHPRDMTLKDTVIRGMKEEFLSTRFAGDILVSLQAITIELKNLNLQFIATVQLPTTSFSEVRRLWSSPDTPDTSEHDLLAAVKIEPNVLKNVLSARCPGDLGEHVTISNPDLHDYLTHPWHPRSPERIACCLWMMEEGLLF